ncbi:glycosyltransferase family 39 protein [Tengunoibacter tsumagoiensis]|uniref:Glycosyltransferase RgtA/B/C/D-like domain-containing protein n=1 Tax=Tengunoibacter tsumagoiensis TaxID=2014871 RepID=A0A401ZUF0_9CHLR|nr:glycosyltransferase family 39 protein [Tengunoibacter tsumagoiensis]GCE10545.1 hypothetical protein KTT_04040 [Tengunoibacter tsumagoiensis]
MFQKDAWKNAIAIFLISRLLILILTYFAVTFFGSFHHQECFSVFYQCSSSWFKLDTVHYVEIAYHGYPDLARYEAAFFPFYPLLIHLFGSIGGGSYLAYVIASFVIANLSFLLALVLFYHLVAQDFSPEIARTGLFLLAFHPLGLFFFAGYTESLFLLLILCFFLCLRHGATWNWWLAGCFGCCAMATRGTGLILLVPFTLTFLQRFWPQRRRWRYYWPEMLQKGAASMLIPLGLLLYMFYLLVVQGNAFLFSEGEKHWGRYPGIPFSRLPTAVYSILFLPQYRERNLMDLLLTLLPIIVLLLGWRLLPKIYAYFAAALILYSLLYPYGGPAPFTSDPRYLLMLFPCIIVLAIWSKRPQFKESWLVISVVLFTINIFLFLSSVWVA